MNKRTEGMPVDAVGMREALARGLTSPEVLVAQAIERAEAVNPLLNFIAWPAFGRARAQAIEQRTGLLAGIPTLIKDSIEERGMPASWGSKALRQYIARDDSSYTRAIANAGLISIARSAMPEFALNAVTESPLVGPTRNPWSRDHTPGGSSGGGAAAVAAGVVPLAHASDGLGSIRHAAGPCGLVGLKPSRGRNFGDEALRSITDLNVDGCVSRTVRDTAAWLEATQSLAASAAYSPVTRITAPIDRPLRIQAYSEIMRTDAAPDASVSRVFADTVDLLGRLGHQVAEGRLPFDGPDMVRSLFDAVEGRFARGLEALSQQLGFSINLDDVEYRSATLIAAGKAIDDERYESAWRDMQTCSAAYLDRLGEIDIWMTPTLGAETVRIGVFGPEVAWLDQREPLLDYAGYCWIDNVAGTPSISLPMGFSENRLPVGIQFATRPGGEALLLALAYQLETAIEWWRHTPPIWAGENQ
jgi:amidase